MRVRVLVFLALLLLATLGGGIADTSAQTPSPDDINRVAKQLSCPTCAGINVADCPTETCAQWRAKIGELLAAGKTDQEILEYFASRYGDHVLQVPPPRGFFLGVWIVPVLAILAALGTFGYLVHRWTQRSARPETSAASPEEVEDEYLRRVQRELDTWWK
ncbi:MAG: cytochrome c-type biogenesis protein CcmH [Anaerolineae bacterium]|nr:cytochrome c-type biogenesis protein CcmH [Anaerolineae bacterium]MDW8071526.1 cytochrome c-type biogenesis protein CcmH [Anaerolineae bacterium]